MLGMTPDETFWVLIIAIFTAGGTITSVVRSIARRHHAELEDDEPAVGLSIMARRHEDDE